MSRTANPEGLFETDTLNLPEGRTVNLQHTLPMLWTWTIYSGQGYELGGGTAPSEIAAIDAALARNQEV